jgi:polyisoprenoid-binding protein YceI
MHQPLTDDRVATALDGEAPLLLPTGRWAVDREASGVLFSVRQMGLFNVRGRFDDFDATLDVGPTLAELEVGAVIDLSSVDTGNAKRDAHLRSHDFFDVDQHPTMVFRSTAVGDDDDTYWLGGDVTIGNVQRPVMLDVTFNGLSQSRVDRSLRASFVATGQVRRRDFGFDAAKFVVGNRVEFELDMQFVACGEARIEEAS